MVVFQLVRIRDLGSRGRRFESCLPYEIMGVRRRWRDGLDCKSSALAEQVRILQLPQIFSVRVYYYINNIEQ